MKTIFGVALVCCSLLSSSLLSQVPEPRTALQSSLKDVITPPMRRVLPPAGADQVTVNGAPALVASLSLHSSASAGPAMTFLVTSTNDTGTGSLRRAIEDANSSPGADVIQFQIPGTGVKVISPKSPLPTISDALTIDGASDVGYLDKPRIQVDGALAGDTDGLVIAAPGCTLKAICVTSFPRSGILLLGNSTIVEGCYIGVGPDGITDEGNGRDGISVYSANNQIGRRGTRPNVISGNTLSGVLIADVNATGNVVTNSYFGTNDSANAAVPNDMWGILILNATDARIGGSTIGDQNVVSGNKNGGIGIRGGGAQRIVVEGNRIGIARDSAIAIPNERQGIEVGHDGATLGTPSDVLVGGTWSSNAGNIICGNAGAGVGIYLDGLGGTDIVVAGNMIGVEPAKIAAVPNGHGIYLERRDSSLAMPGVRIGGVRAQSGNIIAGNTWRGIWIYGPGARSNQIRGNHIGVWPLTETSFLRRSNKDFGLVLEEAPLNLLDAADTLSGNIISANDIGGVAITGSMSYGNVLENNYIGTTPGRDTVLGNGYNGVYIESGANGNRIGRINAGNIIAHNQYSGIYATSGVGNTFRGNCLYKNGGLGIDLGPGGITANDSLDLDAGPNALINFPLVESVKLKSDGTNVTFIVNGTPLTQYTVDFYTIASLSTSLFGEGDTLLGYFAVTTDIHGSGTWTILLDRKVTDWQHVTAMMTDAEGNSSEFCRAVCWKDTDGDALLDCWETQNVGMDINMDGLVDLDLYGRGARPDHKDLFVEVDHMDSLEFSPPAREMARNFFLSAPPSLIKNPDKQNGINLHIDYHYSDAAIPPTTWSDPPWTEFHATEMQYFGTEEERAHPNKEMLLKAKRRVYRYCIFGDQFDAEGSAGYAEDIPDNDFVVTLGAWNPRGGTVEQQAGTFIHELGHTMGLHHGGDDDVNYKPNYISVMNYLWCMPPRPNLAAFNLTWQMMFSPSKLDDLVEYNLDERKGLNIPEGLYQPGRFLFGDSAKGYSTGLIYPATPVDWNNDGDSADASSYRELNGMDPDVVHNQRLTGFSDWSALIYDPQSPSSVPSPSPDVFPHVQRRTSLGHPDISPEMYSVLQALPPYGLYPAHRAPYFFPRETTTVGGNFGTIQIGVTIPAPPGGLRYYFHSSAPDLLVVDQEIQIPEDWNEVSVGFSSVGVENDTTVFIYADSLDVPLAAAVTIRKASMVSFSARGDSGCVVTELGGFKKRYLAGCTVLFAATLDGQAPPSGGMLSIASSRPDLIAPPATWPIGSFATSGYVPMQTASNVTIPQMIVLSATYRDTTLQDTVYLMPAPKYTLTKLGSSGSGMSTLELNNAGDVLINWYWIYKDGEYVFPESYPGFRLRTLTGMNDSGWISGSVYDESQAHMLPAYWKPDTTIVLPVPFSGYPYGSTTGINNHGDVIGFCEANTYPYLQKGTIWKNNVATELEEYSEYWPETADLNDAGQVVGTGILRRYPYTQIGLRWDNAMVTAVTYPFMGFNFMNGKAIAADGTTLYASDTYFFRHKEELDAGVPTPPPFVKMRAYDINDSLDVVGSVHMPEGEGYSPFVMKDGYQYDLTCLAQFPVGWSNGIATSINNAGVIVGYAKSNDMNEFFMLTPSGSTGIGKGETDQRIPTEFTLFQNFPNPFNPATTIQYALPTRMHVRMSVYSILGQRVAELVNGIQDAGYQSVRFDGTGLASGMYVYQIRAGSIVQSRKFLLLK